MADPGRLGGLVLLALLAGCAAPVPHGAAIEQWADRVVPATSVPTRLTLAIAPAGRGYRTQYVRVLDWERAEASLTHPDPAIAPQSQAAPATVEPDNTRRASLAFAPVRPASGYTLTVALKRRAPDGTWRTVASGANGGVVIAPGANAATIAIAPTADGEMAVSVPQPSLVAPAPTPEPAPGPAITSFFPASGSVGMRIRVSGSAFSSTLAANAVAFGGVAATPESGDATALTVPVPAGAVTGPLSVTVAGQTGTSPLDFTVVASGAPLGNFSIGSHASPALSMMPYGMAVDGTGDVWVCQYGAGTVSRVSSAGAVLGTYGCGAAPVAVAIDGGGTVWVANETAGTVTRLSPAGETLSTTAVGATPAGIAFDAAGRAYVSGFGAGTVTQLAPDGAVLSSFSAGCLNPAGLLVDASDVVWVAQHDLNRVARFSPTGALLSGTAVGTGPSALARGANGEVWAANYGSGEVSRLSSAGGLLGTYACNASPRALAFDLNGALWVANGTLAKLTRLSAVGALLGTTAVGAGPAGLALDRSGALWVASYGTGNVRKLAP